jgi:hypothetical protein
MRRIDYINGGAHIVCKRGNDLPQAKLTTDLVSTIRTNRFGWTAKKWAEHLGLHIRTIEKVRDRKTWSHV